MIKVLDTLKGWCFFKNFSHSPTNCAYIFFWAMKWSQNQPKQIFLKIVLINWEQKFNWETLFHMVTALWSVKSYKWRTARDTWANYAQAWHLLSNFSNIIILNYSFISPKTIWNQNWWLGKQRKLASAMFLADFWNFAWKNANNFWPTLVVLMTHALLVKQLFWKKSQK